MEWPHLRQNPALQGVFPILQNATLECWNPDSAHGTMNPKATPSLASDPAEGGWRGGQWFAWLILFALGYRRAVIVAKLAQIQIQIRAATMHA
jgi:hypothetical protein